MSQLIAQCWRSIRHLLLVMPLAFASTPLLAQGETILKRQSPQVIARQDEKPRQTMTAAQAARIAQSRHGGKVLSVETERTESGVRYKVKLLQDNGRVKTVTING